MQSYYAGNRAIATRYGHAPRVAPNLRNPFLGGRMHRFARQSTRQYESGTGPGSFHFG
jgi:hypothetical protein